MRNGQIRGASARARARAHEEEKKFAALGLNLRSGRMERCVVALDQPPADQESMAVLLFLSFLFSLERAIVICCCCSIG